VGLFRRKPKAPPPSVQGVTSVTATPLPANGRCQVAGVSYHQDEIRNALRGASAAPPTGLVLRGEDDDAIGWTYALLFPWTDEPHDPSAVAVFLAGAKQVGWIPAKLSADFREMLRVYAYEGHGEPLGLCPAYFDAWGERGEMLGVRLCCSWPSDVLDDPGQEPEYEVPDLGAD